MFLKINYKPWFGVSFFDKKTKPVFIIYFSGVFATALLFFQDILQGNHYSCLVDLFVVFGLVWAIRLYFKKGKHFYGHLFATTTVSIGIFLGSVLEGLSSGTFIFFIPLMLAIPFAISRNENWEKLTYIFYSVTIFFSSLPGQFHQDILTYRILPLKKLPTIWP